MYGRFALYDPIKLRREAKLDDFRWLDTLVERIVCTTVEPELAYYPVTKVVGAPKNNTSCNSEVVADLA